MQFKRTEKNFGTSENSIISSAIPSVAGGAEEINEQSETRQRVFLPRFEVTTSRMLPASPQHLTADTGSHML